MASRRWAAIGSTGDVESENRAHSALSHVANIRGDAVAMREHSNLAIAGFERSGHERLLSVALCNRGAAEFELGRLREARQFGERAGAVAAGVDARDVVTAALIVCAEAEVFEQRFADVAKNAAHALATVRATGEERIIAEALLLLGAAKCALGESVAGLHDLHESVARHRAAGSGRALAHALTYLLEAQVGAGEQADSAHTAAELSLLDLASAPFPARIQLVLGLYYRAAGNPSMSRECWEAGRRLLRARLSALTREDAQAYRGLPFSRELLHPTASGRPTR